MKVKRFFKENMVSLIVIVVNILLVIVGFVSGYAVGHCSNKPSQNEEVIQTAETHLPMIVNTDDNITENYTITAYCSCSKCCGSYANNRKNGIVVGAEGTDLIAGYSAANNELSFGTVLNVDGYGVVEIQDRTSNWIDKKYNGKIIDIYFDSHEKALEFGKKTDVKVTIIKTGG